MFIYQNRKLIIATFIVLGILAVIFSFRLNLIYDFERFFPQGDDDLDVFNEYREIFGADDDFLMIAFETKDSTILKPPYLEKIDTLTKTIQNVDGVVRAQSVTNFKNFFISGTGFGFPINALRYNDAKKFEKDRATLLQDNRIMGKLVSYDNRSASIILFLDTLDMEQGNMLINALDSIIPNHWDEAIHYVGKANFETRLKGTALYEFGKSTLISVILVIVTFAVFYKNRKSILFALISMLMCLLAFTGLLGLFRVPVDLLAAFYPIIIIIVGISDVIHITSKYIVEVKKGQSKKQAIAETFRSIGMATFLTSITTAIGFLSLYFTNVIPVRVMGVTSAAGILLTFGVVIFLTTALFSFIPENELEEPDFKGNFFKGFLERTYQFTLEKQRLIIALFLVTMVVCGFGISQIKTDNDITSSLPKNDKVREDFLFFEEHFSGFRPYEFVIRAQDDYEVDDYEVLKEIDKLENHLTKYELLSSPNSLTDIYKTINRATYFNQVSYYKLPNEPDFKKMKRYVKFIPKNFSSTFYSEDKKLARISTTIKDVGSTKINILTDSVKTYINNDIDTSKITVDITGTGVLIDKNDEYLRKNLLYGLSFAVILIGIIMVILFRDLRLFIVSIIPNIVPLLVGAAAMGILGINLDAPTSMVFAISFGIAVDDTIHFLSKLKLELNKGKSLESALKVTTIETGRAIIVTTIILFFGFLILLFSNTPGMNYVGLLISLTLISAVISDLLMIPILCRWLLKGKN